MIVCHRGHNALARMLLDAGATTGEAKSGRGTPLISAASVGNADCVKMLLDEGIEEELETRFQELTALEWAQKGGDEGHSMCVQLLESALENSSLTLAREEAAEAVMARARKEAKALEEVEGRSEPPGVVDIVSWLVALPPTRAFPPPCPCIVVYGSPVALLREERPSPSL